jgi:hypothetical protein
MLELANPLVFLANLELCLGLLAPLGLPSSLLFRLPVSLLRQLRFQLQLSLHLLLERLELDAERTVVCAKLVPL